MSTNAPDDESLSLSSSEEGASTTTKVIMLGKFRLIAVLGKGAMGKVVRAEDTKLKRQVALKCMRAKKGPATYRVEQFVREARSAATLEHPHIVQIYEVGEAAGYHYIAMELIEGGDLGSLIKGIGALDMHRACQLGAEAAEALAHAAQMGVVHRDIKPQNLMLTRAGRCKITDFGLARIDDPADGFAMPKGAVGTPSYMPPEVIRRERATPKSDVYSLGCVLVYLLTGRPPFDTRDREQLLKSHLESPPPDIRALRPDLPESLAKVVSRAMAKQPEDRPTAEMLAKQLRAHTIPMGSGSVVASAASSPFITPNLPAPAAPAETHKKPRVFLYGALAGTAAALVLAAAAIVISSHNKVQPASAETPVVMQPSAPVALPQAPVSTPVTPAPVPEKIPVAAAPIPPAAHDATPSEPPSDVRAAVAVVVKPAAPVNEIPATDASALLTAAKANRKIALVGTVSDVHIDSANKLAIVSFSGNPDLHITYYQRLYSSMTKKFGGKDGNGLVGKSVRITGYSSLLDGKPQLIVNTLSQIELKN